jgi:predicted ATP-dependent Lon-type protease
MALFGLIRAWNYSAETARSAVGGSPRSGFESASDAGAQRVLIPTENSRDFATLPAGVLDKLRIEFYSEPSQAALKALAE